MIVHYSGFCMGRLGKRSHGRSRRALNFEGVEEEQFQAEIAKLEVGQKEKIMGVMTSWERKGMEKGIEKGVEKEKQAIALNLLRENLPLETIARTTGLTIVQLQDLQIQSAAT